MSPHPPQSRNQPPAPLRWFRNVFEPLPPLEQPRHRRAAAPTPPPQAKIASAPKPSNGHKNEAPAPLPIANPLLESPGGALTPRSPDEVTEAIREVNTAVAALSQLESTSSHPAKDLIGKVARTSLRDVGRLLQRIQRPHRR